MAILLLLLFDGFVLGVLHYQNNSCKHHKLTYYDVKIQTQSAFHILANMTNYANTEDKLYEYLKTDEKQNLYNVPQKKNGKSRSIPKKYIKSERNPNGIDIELAQKPCFYHVNSLFFINSYKNSCKHTDFEHPENSDCYITVDFNGFAPPNKLLEIDFDLKNKEELYSGKLANGDEIIFVIASREDNSLYPMPSNKYRQLILKR
ncbi:MAG: hypothetical protein K6C94_05875 [Candidatus Gastranaerophilales bacterium]|nr:hypothetical protein [Candidatus Gastranaerophilales bacterium]